MTTAGSTVRLATVAAIALSGAAMVRSQQTFRTRVELVSVPVSVSTGGKSVAGLTAVDFEVTDNGVRQEIEAIWAEQIPIDLTMILTSYPPDRVASQRQGLVNADATRRLLRPQDRLRIVSVRDDVEGSISPTGSAVPTERANYFMGVALADGLFYALAWPVPAGRRHLAVAFTDGWDTASTLEIEMLPKLAARSEAVLHVVLSIGPQDGIASGGGVRIIGNTPPEEWQHSRRVIEETASQTGGTIHDMKQPTAVLANVIDNFRNSYVLHYTPRDVAKPGWHQLNVRVSKVGVFTVRARKGYEGQ